MSDEAPTDTIKPPTVTFRLSEEMHEKLCKRSQQEERSKSAFIRYHLEKLFSAAPEKQTAGFQTKPMSEA